VAVVAVDTVGAGAGETVLVVVEGRSTSMAMDRKLAPANAAIVGIVDHIDWER
jgi:ethanolamine utilization protein EutN